MYYHILQPTYKHISHMNSSGPARGRTNPRLSTQCGRFGRGRGRGATTRRPIPRPGPPLPPDDGHDEPVRTVGFRIGDIVVRTTSNASSSSGWDSSDAGSPCPEPWHYAFCTFCDKDDPYPGANHDTEKCPRHPASGTDVEGWWYFPPQPKCFLCYKLCRNIHGPAHPTNQCRILKPVTVRHACVCPRKDLDRKIAPRWEFDVDPKADGAWKLKCNACQALLTV
jgi:hypothetical protein